MMSLLVTFLLLCLICVSGQQQHRPIELNIPEELDANTQVSDLALEAGLKQQYDASVLDMLQFEFLQSSGDPHQSYFSVDHDSGILTIAKRIDREKICAYKVTCVLMLDIVIQPFTYFRIIKIHINVLDINDNSPTFPNQEVARTLSEASRPGTAFSIPAAEDPDSPRNGIHKYELVSGSVKFDMKESTNTAGETKLQLVLKGRLDREVQDSYQVRITATDGGVPARTGSLVVNIVVRDINDNIPVFDNTTYMVKVRENLSIGSVLLRVHASDPDAGLNGKVLYGFSERTYSTFGSLYGINNFTGEIYLKSELDYEIADVYHLTVIARDQSPDAMSMDADVQIYVTDVNDHAPKISVNTFTSTGMATVSEWTKLGEFVARVAISDADSEQNGRFSCQVSDSHFKLEHSNGYEHKLLTAGTFDRELHNRYNVTVTCRDWGSPQLTSTESIPVLVLDENDNYPVFTNSPYMGSLAENNDIGASIIQISANDPDLADNGFVLYKLDGVQEDMVEVTKNGWIKATAVFDFEQIQTISFEVIAYDQGIPSRSVSTSVTVNILNVNDEPPVFSQATYYFSVTENEPVNTEVGQVSASDADSSPYNEFGFMIRDAMGAQSASAYFYIDSETGTIKTKRMLDREKEAVHYLEAVAIDKGDSPMTGTVSVTVHVNDKNDNIPIIDFPNPANKSVTVPAQIPQGYEVTQINAHDDDNGDNQKLSFYIIDQTQEETFTIDPWTGVITLNSKLDFEETTKKVKLNIQVKDNGEPNQHSVDTSLEVVFDKSIPFVKPENRNGDILGEEDAFILILSCVISISVLLIMFLASAIICVRRRRERNLDYPYPAAKVLVKPVAPHHDQVRSVSRLPSPMTSHQGGTVDGSLGFSGRRTPTDNSAILYHYQGTDGLKKTVSMEQGHWPGNKVSHPCTASTACSEAFLRLLHKIYFTDTKFGFIKRQCVLI